MLSKDPHEPKYLAVEAQWVSNLEQIICLKKSLKKIARAVAVEPN